jgi:hypothetical protein
MSIAKKISALALGIGLITGGLGSAFANSTTTVPVTGTYTAPDVLSVNITPTSLSFDVTSGTWDKKSIRVTNNGDIDFYPEFKLYEPTGFGTYLDDGSLTIDTANPEASLVGDGSLHLITTRASSMGSDAINLDITDPTLVDSENGFNTYSNKEITSTDLTNGFNIYPTSGTYMNDDFNSTNLTSGDFIDLGLYIGSGTELTEDISFSFKIDVNLITQ